MGLIKAAASAIGGTLQDQWKEAIRCDDMTNDILMMKRTTPTGVISNKSTIIVGPGQIAIIYDNGRIVDATAEDGVYTFDTSSTPSFFAGQFGDTFKEMWQRFTYNGATAKQQAVFFFNAKEIIDNKFGTPAPIPYRDWEHAVMNARTGGYTPMRVEVKCFGKYTFKIENPAVFMQELAGTAEVYTKQEIVEQMRSEVIASFTNVLNGLGNDEHKIGVLSLPSQTDEIKTIMDENVFDKPIRDRGLKLVGFIVESVTLDDESEKKIDAYEMGGDAFQQKGVLTGAYAQAVQDAANNQGGAMNGFMGVGMMNMATGSAVSGAANSAMNTPMQPAPIPGPTAVVATTPAASEVKCPKCGAAVNGKFCSECGASVSTVKKCSNCGKDVEGKFCTECGTKAE